MTAAQLIGQAGEELGIQGAAESLSAADADLFLGRLNLIVDQWNAVRQAVFVSDMLPFTLAGSGTNPTTIGPTGYWVVAQRPEKIEAANLIIVASPPASVVQIPIAIATSRWWMSLTVPGVTTMYPEAVYYEPSWPNGKLDFWPVPTTAYGVTLMVPHVLSQYDLTTTFTMPPGYHAALLYTLAEACAAPMRVELKPQTSRLAALARSVIGMNNTESIQVITRDAGMPNPRTGTGYSNWLYQTGDYKP